ncbi:MAG: fused MFS/spermidine synthase, partial [Candidatus Eremiobacterota bacterium]
MTRVWTRPGEVGAGLSSVYGWNTLGAFLGAVLAGFVLLPTVGLRASLLGAASVNLLVAAGAFLLARPGEDSLLRGDREPPGNWRVPIAFALTGLASMALQVGWTRALVLSLGSSVYAFSAILSLFLAGIGLGSLLFRRWRRRPELGTLAWLQAAVGFTAALTIPLLGWLPFLFLKLFPYTGGEFPRVLAMDLGLISLFILPPTLLMGFAFPLGVALHCAESGGIGGRLAQVYASNTAGCIVGAFAAGFLGIPHLGVQWTLMVASILVLAVAAWLFWHAGRHLGLAAALGAAVLTGLVPPWDTGLMGSGAAVYADVHSGQTRQQLDRFLFTRPGFYRDGISCTVAVHFRPEAVSLRVNGKVDASTSSGDLSTQYLLGYLPGLLHREPRTVMVVGLGSGMTLQALASFPEIQTIDCAELEPAVVEAQAIWRFYNGHVLSDSRVRLLQTDGRTAVSGSTRRFDLIVSEPSNPWVAGVGNLFAREFYRDCRERLATGGLMAQWVQIYELSEPELGSIVHTFFSVFPHGDVWMTAGGDLVLIGAEQPVPVKLQDWRRRWSTNPTMQLHMARVDVFAPEVLTGYYLFERDAARAAFQTCTPNTDDLPLLEFRAPLALYRAEQLEQNQERLSRIRQGPLPPGVKETPALVSVAAQGWLNTMQLKTFERWVNRPDVGRPNLLMARL